MGIVFCVASLYALWFCVLLGFYALLISGIAVGAGVYNGVDLVYIHTHFLQFYTSALLISILLSIYLFARSRWVSDDERAPAGNSGSCVLLSIILLNWFNKQFKHLKNIFNIFLFRLCSIWFLHGTWAESTNQRFWHQILLWNAPRTYWLGRS